LRADLGDQIEWKSKFKGKKAVEQCKQVDYYQREAQGGIYLDFGDASIHVRGRFVGGWRKRKKRMLTAVRTVLRKVLVSLAPEFTPRTVFAGGELGLH
jgi:hypothetical protein